MLCSSFVPLLPVVDADGNCTLQCSLEIARRKPPPPRRQPFVPNPKILTTTGTPQSSLVPVLKPVTEKDIGRYVSCIMKAFHDPQRMLGARLTDSLLRSCMAASPMLCGCDFYGLKQKWDRHTQSAEASMSRLATEFWIKEWEKERNQCPIENLKVKYLTDAKRANLRYSPRKTKGCRCGSKDHEYVDDPECPLYTDVRPLSSWEAKAPEVKAKAKKKSGEETRQLGTVEAGIKERFLKQQAETRALEQEASFVEEMEATQVQKLKKAIFAPSLTTMVLSAVFELQANEYEDYDGFPGDDEPLTAPSPNTDIIMLDKANPSSEAIDKDDDDDDDDEDIPLAALGKRTAETDSSTKKKVKEIATFHPKFLTDMLRLISHRWGHLYREPDDAEYAWYVYSRFFFLFLVLPRQNGPHLLYSLFRFL